MPLDNLYNKMKTSTWLIVGAVVIAAYAWITSTANKISFVLQNVGIGQNGLLTQLTVTMLITNATTSTITLTNLLLTATYNGTMIGSGLTASAVIAPGANSIPFNINLSDLTLLGDLAGIVTNGVTGISINITGKGLADNLPVSFNQNYMF